MHHALSKETLRCLLRNQHVHGWGSHLEEDGDKEQEPQADDGEVSGDEVHMDEVGSDQDEEDERDDDMDDAMQPLTLDAQFSSVAHFEAEFPAFPDKTPMHEEVPEPETQALCSHADDTLKDSVPSPSKGIEVDHEDKCVLIDDSPAKGTDSDDLEPDEIAIQIRELQKALANAKREQMAMIFGIVINSAFDEHSFTSAAFAFPMHTSSYLISLTSWPLELES